MSNKDAILKAIAGLPDAMNWEDVANRVASLAARDATERDVARFLAAAFPITPDEIAGLVNPPTDGIELADLLKEIESAGPTGSRG